MAVIDLVKYNGPNSVFAWKFPSEELSTWTQLIVAESQEAVFFKGGQALDVFGPGRHTLSTANVPILAGLFKLPFGGQSPFTAEVWFVNKAHSLDIKWGTPSPIQLQDPKFGVMIPVRSFGQFGIRIANSSKFLIKLVGTVPVFDQETLLRHFKGVYLNKVKDSLAGYLVNKKIGVLEINAYLDELSEHMRERIKPTFDDYGIELVNFYVNDISVPENDPAVIQLKAALAKRAEMDIIGYNYQQERTFDTLEGAATNPGAGQAGMMGAGIGLGMGLGVGGAMGGQFGSMAQNLSVTGGGGTQCPNCHGLIPDGKRFCPDCGQPLAQNQVKPPPQKAVITCDKCGTVIPDGAQFCPNCGDPYNPCPNCGKDLPSGTAKCPSCGAMIPIPCPLCGQKVSPDAKFCPSCGGAIAKKCPHCGHDLSLSSKFCPNCGQKI
ncbi:MAG: SPFH domain-containing protein [Deltaproteobacteria bacterium]|jgi:membrane protease subunit (stomatin/prohibitin family)|nr:SPFH domain-containing protein [Deltaproteobacteria bacterium]